MCPHGFDPDDSARREKKLLLTIAASNGAALQGKFVLSFHTHSVEFDAPLESVTSDACTHIFRRFQTFGKVVRALPLLVEVFAQVCVCVAKLSFALLLVCVCG